MRVLAVHPETLGDPLLRRPLYEALSAAGHELTLVVRASLAPLVPTVAPHARVLTLDDESQDQQAPTDTGQGGALIAAARAVEPHVLLVGPHPVTGVEQRLAEAMPDVRRVGTDHRDAPSDLEGVLRAIGNGVGSNELAGHRGNAHNGHTNGASTDTNGSALHADERAELEMLRRRVRELERTVDPLPASSPGTQLSAQPSSLQHRVHELEAELDAVRGDAFRWMLETNVRAPAPPVTFQAEREAGLVSVIIPAYNAAAFIEACVKSVWRQKPGGFTTEILLCDDGSTDRTWELAMQLRAYSPVRMEVLTHPDRTNRGVSATRNLGLSAARGEFVALLDVDDRWLADRLDVQVRHLRSHPKTQVVCSLGRNCDASGESVVGFNGNGTAGDFRHVLPPNDFSPPYTFDQLLKGDPIVNSTLLIRRSALEAVGGYPRLMAHQAEDWLLLAKLALLAPIDLVDAELIDYTVHPGSYTTQFIRHNFAFGSRIEFLFHLVHWMVRQPEYRDAGEQLFRREYPRMVAAHAPAYHLIEEYCRRHNTAATEQVAAFEAHLSGLYAEVEQLRLYAGERDWIMNILRKVPGLRTAYGVLRHARQKR